MRTLTTDEARKFYDKFGARQDQQSFYERKALETLVEAARFGEAESVFEFGCGTGKFALELLEDHLSPTCRYKGVDVSSTMIGIASARLAPFAPRASAELTPGGTEVLLADGSVDRFVSTYVVDLLSESAAEQLVAEAHRVLRPDGLLGLVGITPGTTLLSKTVMSLWRWLFSWQPEWVGGCRPIRTVERLRPTEWTVVSHEVVVAWGIASEVTLATPRTAEASA